MKSALTRRVKASKAAKTVTTAAKLSKHACSGAKQGVLPFVLPFEAVVQACCISTYIDKVEHHGSPGAQFNHQEAPANAATAVYASREEFDRSLACMLIPEIEGGKLCELET